MTCKCGSGKPADLLCDWKTPEGPAPTCDKPLCADCSHKPAEGKDLCPAHAFEWKVRQAFKEPPPAEAQNPERTENGRSSPNYDRERAGNRGS